jgi:hypothetical protein
LLGSTLSLLGLGCLPPKVIDAVTNPVGCLGSRVVIAHELLKKGAELLDFLNAVVQVVEEVVQETHNNPVLVDIELVVREDREDPPRPDAPDPQLLPVLGVGGQVLHCTRRHPPGELGPDTLHGDLQLHPGAPADLAEVWQMLDDFELERLLLDSVRDLGVDRRLHEPVEP